MEFSHSLVEESSQYLKISFFFTPKPYYLDTDENAMKTSKLSYVNTTLFGPTCDSLDMVRDNIYLPDSLGRCRSPDDHLMIIK